MTDNNKHLVRVGHEFAAAMSDDTPIITIAKMVTELASALDVQSARSEALAAKLNDVCAESAALKKFIREKCFVVPDGASCFAEADECAEKRMPETPNTDAWVNEQRAVGVDGAINVILTMMDRIAPAHHAISMLRAHAAQLRGSQV